MERILILVTVNEALDSESTITQRRCKFTNDFFFLNLNNSTGNARGQQCAALSGLLLHHVSVLACRGWGALPAPTLLDVIEAMCARGFLRQATRLAVTSKEVGAACPMGTGKQIHDAATEGNAAALTTYLAYWRGSRESNEVLNWDVGHWTPLSIAALDINM